MNHLPESFLQSIRDLLDLAGMSNSYDDFIASYDKQTERGLRLNTLKTGDLASLRKLVEAIWSSENGDQTDPQPYLTVVPWSDDGYYYRSDLSVGRSLANRLGLYYIQEPSAMLPAQALGAQPGERVIDLCAAPGGKSARIAADLKGEGLLLSNDISSSRGRILVRNLEQLGVDNAVVTAADPVDLAKRWPAYFDRVLVDAPCSGEGMFRRDPKAIASWSEYGPDSIIPIQRNILDAAFTLLKDGGTLIYSTCTFNRAENEQQIEDFMDRHPEMELIDLHAIFPEDSNLKRGINMEDSSYDMSRSARIWPHRSRGEGHFCARLMKRMPSEDAPGKDRYKPMPRKLKAVDRALLYAFYQDILSESGWDRWQERLDTQLSLDHGRYHLVPDISLNLKSVHILKEGIYLANLKEGRKQSHIEPAHAAVLCLGITDIRPERMLCIDKNDRRVEQVVKGETIALTADEMARLQAASRSVSRGYLVLMVEDMPLSWVKLDQGGTLKNMYPAGWRQA